MAVFESNEMGVPEAKRNVLVQTLGMCLAFACIALFFHTTTPSIASDVEDTYAFVGAVESDSFLRAFHPQHMLQVTLGVALHRLFPHISGLSLLIWISHVSGIAAILLFYKIMQLRASEKSKVAIVFCGFLCFSFAFWRYACSADTYVLSISLDLLFCFLLFKLSPSMNSAFWLGLVALLCILAHITNIALVCFAVFPFFYLDGRKLPHYIVYVTTLACSVVITYALFYDVLVGEYSVDAFWTWFKVSAEPGAALPLIDLLRPIASFSQNVVAVTFLLSFSWFQAFLTGTFPDKTLSDDFYLGDFASNYFVFPAVMSFLVLFGMVSVLFKKLLISDFSSVYQALKRKEVVLALIWMLAAGAINFSMGDRTSPEIWIIPLAPFWMIAAYSIPDVALPKIQGWLWALVVVLGVHNYFGGMAILGDENCDYVGKRIEAISRFAKEGDAVLCNDKASFLFQLRYECDFSIINICASSPEAIEKSLQEARMNGVRLFVLGEAVDFPLWFELSARDLEKMRRVVGTITPNLEPVYKSELMVLYEWKPEPKGALARVAEGKAVVDQKTEKHAREDVD